LSALGFRRIMGLMPNSARIRVSVVIVCLSIAAAVPFAMSHHAAVVISHYLKGRASTCTLSESFEGEALSRLGMQNFAELRAASRVTRQDAGLTLWSTPAGDYWMPTASGEALLYDLAEQKRNIYGDNMRHGDTVLDCGANVGVFTRKALWAGAAQVIAIEPAPDNLECLRRNFVPEIASGRVVVYPKGVWDKEDVLKLSVDPGNSARDSFVNAIPNAGFIEAPLTTIDQMAADLHLARVDFIKMDIEGAEQKAIAGARKTIARWRPRMALCVYHLREDAEMVPKAVRGIVADYHFRQTCLCGLDRVQPEVALFY
jgi:FkbM family methyltransferase